MICDQTLESLLSQINWSMTFLNVNPCLCNVLPIVAVEAVELHTSWSCSCSSCSVIHIQLSFNAALEKLERSTNYGKEKYKLELTHALRLSSMQGQPGHTGLCTDSPVSQNVWWRCFIASSGKKQWTTLQYIAYIALIARLLASKIIVCGSAHQMFCSTTIGW